MKSTRMIKIIGLFPLTGNGGIASWTKKFLSTFPDSRYKVYPINVAPDYRTGDDSILYRALTGFKTLIRVLHEIKEVILREKIDILHTTTSGNIGSYRDLVVAKLCRKYGIKCVMHCRYGCITEDIRSKGLVGLLVRRAMALYDQIWVLDSRSYNTLKNIPHLSSKVYVTPNSIDINEQKDLTPKTYKRIVFVGNLIPSKGIYELVEACTRIDVRLDIVGPGTDDVIKKIKAIAFDKMGKSIFIHGRTSNADAVNVIKKSDIVALPTYYPSEAFPISIIEAMSLTKMVISCPRAAIEDMLTGLDGVSCGILVKPQSSDEIVSAIIWCQTNPIEADMMCQRAYDKVRLAYSKEVVYDIYRENYNRLVKS